MIFKLLKWLVYIGLVLAAGVAWVVYDVNQFVQRPILIKNQLNFSLKPGTRIKGLAKDLKKYAVIGNPRYFEWYARATRKASRIKAGEYLVIPGATPKELLTQFVRGAVIQYGLTFVEGWTFKQMLDSIQANEYLQHTLAGLDHAQVLQQLGIPVKHPEGLFYPDTYLFPKGDTDVNLLRRAYAKMRLVLNSEWKARDQGLPYKSAYEALIMASIVEKETADASERDVIAGVFVRRLQKNMRLQTDPTVIYGLGDKFDGNIRRKDLQNPHPYNTYVHRGLPPTPIAMPGGEAIRAALHPKLGKELYFVARGNGSHYFSRTLKEHNAAVRRYQLKKRRRRKKH